MTIARPLVNLGRVLLALALGSVLQPVQASEITGTDLLNLLVDSKVISEQQADELVDRIQRRSQPDPNQPDINPGDVLQLLMDSGAISESAYQDLMQKLERRKQAMSSQQGAESKADSSSKVRVPYLPDYIRRDLEQSIKHQVEVDVVQKVKDEAVRTARVYGWGIEEAPGWVHSLKISGDGRIRYQWDHFPDDNAAISYPDLNAINDSGELVFNNVEDDRHRFRSRFRVLLKAKPSERIELGVRLTTGDEGDPVSANQTLGRFSQKWDASFDLGYIKFTSFEENWVFAGGRVKNPFLHTDLVFDSDMTFEGLYGTHYWLRQESVFDDQRQWDPYITIGLFPLQEIHSSRAGLQEATQDLISEINDQDKYLYAAQIGASYDFINRNKLEMGLAYYKYDQIQGRRNPFEGTGATDATASQFYQLGNSLIQINHPNDPVKLGLASGYELINATVKYTMVDFFPTYVFLHADFVKNLDFDQDYIDSLYPGVDVPSRDQGYEFGIAAGTSTLTYLRDWRVSFLYRHLEGDAVLDAFADSDFLLGGTDAEGYILQFQYGIYDNTVVSAKWLSADAIDADPSDSEDFNLSVDTLQVDVSASF